MSTQYGIRSNKQILKVLLNWTASYHLYTIYNRFLRRFPHLFIYPNGFTAYDMLTYINVRTHKRRKKSLAWTTVQHKKYGLHWIEGNVFQVWRQERDRKNRRSYLLVVPRPSHKQKVTGSFSRGDTIFSFLIVSTVSSLSLKSNKMPMT